MGMRRIIGILRLVLVISILALAVGCSHGGGGDDGFGTPESTVTVSGVAAAGPILGGTVRVLALNADGSVGAQLGETKTSSMDGTYSIDIGSYSGNILVGVTGGTYKDEATGAIHSNTLLRAAVTGVSGGTVTLAVTPLTELSVQLASTLSLTTNAINNFNTLVSCMIGVNILGVLPVDVTDENAANAGSAEQGTYGLMLATLSQMNVGKAEGDTLAELKSDLADGRLDATGSSVSGSLSMFVSSANNKSGVSADTVEDTSLFKSIVFITNYPIQITPVENLTELNKAKKLVTDLRNTVLSIYNYKGVGAPGMVNTPVADIQSEVQTELAPELTNTVTRVHETFSAIRELVDFTLPYQEIPIIIEEQTGVDTYDYKTYILVTELSLPCSIAFTLNKDTFNGEEVGNGIIAFDDPDFPTMGSMIATFDGASPDVQATINADFTATPGQGQYTYEDLTLVGNLKVESLSDSGTMLEMDFSQAGRGLSATFAPIPAGNPGFVIEGLQEGTYFTLNSYPTSVNFKGLVKMRSARLDVTIGISNIVYVGGEVPVRPKTASVTGVFEPLGSDGNPLGTKFTGTINGSWANAATFHFITDEEEEAAEASGIELEDVTETNWPQWTATFSGSIEAPSRPKLTATLTATQNAWNNIIFDVNFTYSIPGTSVTFLSGTGSHNTTTDISIGNLSSQDSQKIAFTYDPNRDENQELAGTIKSAGGVTQAVLYTVEGAPVVKFIDNYFESLF